MTNFTDNIGDLHGVSDEESINEAADFGMFEIEEKRVTDRAVPEESRVDIEPLPLTLFQKTIEYRAHADEQQRLEAIESAVGMLSNLTLFMFDANPNLDRNLNYTEDVQGLSCHIPFGWSSILLITNLITVMHLPVTDGEVYEHSEAEQAG